METVLIPEPNLNTTRSGLLKSTGRTTRSAPQESHIEVLTGQNYSKFSPLTRKLNSEKKRVNVENNNNPPLNNGKNVKNNNPLSTQPNGTNNNPVVFINNSKLGVSNTTPALKYETTEEVFGPEIKSFVSDKSNNYSDINYLPMFFTGNVKDIVGWENVAPAEYANMSIQKYMCLEAIASNLSNSINSDDVSMAVKSFNCLTKSNINEQLGVHRNIPISEAEKLRLHIGKLYGLSVKETTDSKSINTNPKKETNFHTGGQWKDKKTLAREREEKKRAEKRTAAQTAEAERQARLEKQRLEQAKRQAKENNIRQFINCTIYIIGKDSSESDKAAVEKSVRRLYQIRELNTTCSLKNDYEKFIWFCSHLLDVGDSFTRTIRHTQFAMSCLYGVNYVFDKDSIKQNGFVPKGTDATCAQQPSEVNKTSFLFNVFSNEKATNKIMGIPAGALGVAGSTPFFKTFTSIAGTMELRLNTGGDGIASRVPYIGLNMDLSRNKKTISFSQEEFSNFFNTTGLKRRVTYAILLRIILSSNYFDLLVLIQFLKSSSESFREIIISTNFSKADVELFAGSSVGRSLRSDIGGLWGAVKHVVYNPIQAVRNAAADVGLGIVGAIQRNAQIAVEMYPNEVTQVQILLAKFIQLKTDIKNPTTKAAMTIKPLHAEDTVHDIPLEDYLRSDLFYELLSVVEDTDSAGKVSRTITEVTSLIQGPVFGKILSNMLQVGFPEKEQVHRFSKPARVHRNELTEDFNYDYNNLFFNVETRYNPDYDDFTNPSRKITSKSDRIKDEINLHPGFHPYLTGNTRPNGVDHQLCGLISQLVYNPTDNISTFFKADSAVKYLGFEDPDTLWSVEINDDSGGKKVQDTKHRIHAFYTIQEGKINLYIGFRGSHSETDWNEVDFQISSGSAPFLDLRVMTIGNFIRKFQTALINTLEMNGTLVDKIHCQVYSTGHSLGGFLGLMAAFQSTSKTLLTPELTRNSKKIIFNSNIFPIVFNPFMGHTMAVTAAIACIPDGVVYRVAGARESLTRYKFTTGDIASMGIAAEIGKTNLDMYEIAHVYTESLVIGMNSLTLLSAPRTTAEAHFMYNFIGFVHTYMNSLDSKYVCPMLKIDHLHIYTIRHGYKRINNNMNENLRTLNELYKFLSPPTPRRRLVYVTGGARETRKMNRWRVNRTRK